VGTQKARFEPSSISGFLAPGDSEARPGPRSPALVPSEWNRPHAAGNLLARLATRGRPET